MLKTLSLAVLSLGLLGASAKAADDFAVGTLDLSATTISDAGIAIDDFGADALDVESLAAEAGADLPEAEEACYRGYGYGYGYGYRSYNCYRPHYSYYSYRPHYYSHCYSHYYRPVYYHSYWGCH